MARHPNESRARNYLRKCVMASEALIISGRYALTADYGDVYHSADLSHCREVIFFRNYEREVMTHGLIAATTASQQVYGLTKDAVDAFLFRDGKPKATTALDTTERATVNADGNYSISGLLQRRDKRLSAITDSIVYFKGATWSRPCSDGAVAPMASSTGYGIRKFDNTTLDSYYRTGSNTNYTDAPIFGMPSSSSTTRRLSRSWGVSHRMTSMSPSTCCSDAPDFHRCHCARPMTRPTRTVSATCSTRYGAHGAAS